MPFWEPGGRGGGGGGGGEAAAARFSPRLLSDRTYTWDGGGGVIPLLAGAAGSDPLVLPATGYILVSIHGFGDFEGNVTWRLASDIAAASAGNPIHIRPTGVGGFTPADIWTVSGAAQIKFFAATPAAGDRVTIWHVAGVAQNPPRLQAIGSRWSPAATAASRTWHATGIAPTAVDDGEMLWVHFQLENYAPVWALMRGAEWNGLPTAADAAARTDLAGRWRYTEANSASEVNIAKTAGGGLLVASLAGEEFGTTDFVELFRIV